MEQVWYLKIPETNKVTSSYDAHIARIDNSNLQINFELENNTYLLINNINVINRILNYIVCNYNR